MVTISDVWEQRNGGALPALFKYKERLLTVPFASVLKGKLSTKSQTLTFLSGNKMRWLLTWIALNALKIQLLAY